MLPMKEEKGNYQINPEKVFFYSLNFIFWGVDISLKTREKSKIGSFGEKKSEVQDMGLLLQLRWFKECYATVTEKNGDEYEWVENRD